MYIPSYKFYKIIVIITIFAITDQQLSALEPVAMPAASSLPKINLDDRDKLFMAIEDRNLAEVEALVAAGISLNPQAYYRTKPLHKAIDTRDHRVVQIVLELSRPLSNFQSDCLVDAYAYSRQRYDFMQRQVRAYTEPTLTRREDYEIIEYLERELSKLSVDVDYRAIQVRVPIRDDADELKYHVLETRPYYSRDFRNFNSAHRQLKAAKLKQVDDLHAELKLDDWRLDDQVSVRDMRIKLEKRSGSKVHVAKISAAEGASKASAEVPDVSVGAAVLQAQTLRPRRPVVQPVSAPAPQVDLGVQAAPMVQDSPFPSARQLFTTRAIMVAISVAFCAFTYKYFHDASLNK